MQGIALRIYINKFYSVFTMSYIFYKIYYKWKNILSINEKYVNEIQEQIKEMIEEGLKNRRPFLEKFGLKDKRSLKDE